MNKKSTTQILKNDFASCFFNIHTIFFNCFFQKGKNNRSASKTLNKVLMANHPKINANTAFLITDFILKLKFQDNIF